MTKGKKIIWTDKQRAYAATAYADGKSTRDLGKEFGVCFQVVALMLKNSGTTLSPGRLISLKMIGKPSHRKGIKASEETRKRMREAAKRRKPTYGYKFTLEQKSNMSAARRRYFANVPKADRKPRKPCPRMSDSERIAINHVRNTAKRLVHRVLKMTRRRKDAKTETLLGYTKSELRAHLEKQFRDEMSWENRSSFHIDHIYPVAAFLRDGITDQRIINALSNLQVLTPFENQSKSDSFDPQMRRMNLTIDQSGTRQGIT